MAANRYKMQPPEAKTKQLDRRLRISLGLMLQAIVLFFALAFASHWHHGYQDQWLFEPFSPLREDVASWPTNKLGYLGALVGYYALYRWWGIAAFVWLPWLFVLGGRWSMPRFFSSIALAPLGSATLYTILWLNVLGGYLSLHFPRSAVLSKLLGGISYAIGPFFQKWLGHGTLILLIIAGVTFLVIYWGYIPLRTKPNLPPNTPSHPPIAPSPAPSKKKSDLPAVAPIPPPARQDGGGEVDFEVVEPDLPQSIGATGLDCVAKSLSDQATCNYDPTLDLSHYQYPPLSLLEAYEGKNQGVEQEELDDHKNKIVETLSHFNIQIAKIKATIGPTVTLYEIVPESGIKISKIKNLEDDIALSLAALGIRIIAPIPGKGTIGIEVPNKNRQIVPLKQLFSTPTFTQGKMALPIVLGKGIANDLFVADLARMPHLLIAGATGQGKSVGLNVLLASLIYKKHPSQLKLVLVDPKKVELSLYNKLERHFLAKLPDAEEAIITETSKVIHTLNSLCMEMDNRYELLKEAGTRNIQEYNQKMVQRRLSPEQGHRFLPYIVLVMDEFADMMMTAGKEIEVPIARLAQLARAIGIHLVLATQRPSVNVITGIIKANFPVRISYKVSSKIDARTILDTSGAEQLVGNGDLLLSMNSEIIRLQAPFLDTAEVERVCHYVGEQQGYPSAYLLPIYDPANNESAHEKVDGERDPLFAEAAALVVRHQQGSTSLIQRKLKLGYNRSGRIMDQLQVAGVVGPFEGSKAREVLLSDQEALDALLTQQAVLEQGLAQGESS